MGLFNNNNNIEKRISKLETIINRICSDKNIRVADEEPSDNNNKEEPDVIRFLKECNCIPFVKREELYEALKPLIGCYFTDGQFVCKVTDVKIPRFPNMPFIHYNEVQTHGEECVARIREKATPLNIFRNFYTEVSNKRTYEKMIDEVCDYVK